MAHLALDHFTISPGRTDVAEEMRKVLDNQFRKKKEEMDQESKSL